MKVKKPHYRRVTKNELDKAMKLVWNAGYRSTPGVRIHAMLGS